LELLRRVVPPVVVADRVSGEVILGAMTASVAVREKMVGFPSVLHEAATNVTAATCLLEYSHPLA
jgi:hypothetical protein